MSESDWYDWLSEHEEIRGGKVQVMGLSRERSPDSLSGSEQHQTSLSASENDSDFEQLQEVDPAYLAAIEDLRLYGAREATPSTRAGGHEPPVYRIQQASPSPPKLDRRQLGTPDDRREGRSMSHRRDRGHSSPLGPGSIAAQRLTRSEEATSRRTQLSRAAGGQLSAVEQRPAHAWMVRKEMRAAEERVILHAEQVASERAREAEDRVGRRVAELEALLEGSGRLREELERVRVSSADLRTSLVTMTISLREELATTRVDC